MTLLNQIVAVEKGLKDRTGKAVTTAYQTIQKSQLFTGISRKYTPRLDEGEQLPSESTRVQATVEEQLAAAANSFTELFDVVLTKEKGNTEAEADVVVGEEILLTNVPISYLLFLEKQLIHWRTIVKSVPTLDPSETWNADENNVGWYRTDPTSSIRTKKVPRNHVKAEATDRHPAQVEVYMEDVPVGTWETTKFSGAIPARRRDQLLSRIDAVIDGVKQAREKANSLTVTQEHAGERVFSFLLA